VPADGHQIDFHIVHIHWNFANCLSGICVEKYLFGKKKNELIWSTRQKSRSYALISHTLCFRHISPISLIGCTTPISLLTDMTEARDVTPGLMEASNCSRSTLKAPSSLVKCHQNYVQINEMENSRDKYFF
jgi:hypothetical protein